MIKIPKDPLYEVSDHDRAWLIALWLIALAAAIAVGAVMVAESGLPRTKAKAPAPAESPPPALQETRTQVETGRMICQRWSDKGCAEWRLYRTTSY